MKKIVSIVMALSLAALSVLFAACGNDPAPAAEVGTAAKDTAAAIETETQPAVTDRSQKSDSLPSDLDFDGEVIRFFIRPEFAKYDAVGENSGDIVYDSVYNRNLDVEERLNVKLSFLMAKETFSEMAAQVESTVLAGDDAYDVIQQRSLQSFQHALKGMFLDLAGAPYIDPDQPWWWMDVIKDTSINTSKLYYLTGDLSLSTFQLSTCCYVNTKMLESFGHDMDGIYDAVEAGKWTWDLFKTYCEGVYTDVNGDGTADGEDIYSFSYYPSGHQWFVYSSGLKFTGRDADGYPVLNIYNSESMRLLETLVDLWHTNNNSYFVDDKFDVMVRKFVAEKYLFCMGRFTHSDIIRSMESPFSIVPYPKLDEKYDYMSGTGASGNFISLPVTTQRQ